MAKKAAKDIERAKADMAVAHEKKMAMIDQVATRAKGAEEATYQKKLVMLDKAAERIADVAAKASSAMSGASEKADELATAVTTTASDVGEAVGAEVDKISMRAGEIGAKTGRRIKQRPWIVALAASVLLLALGMSVGRHYFSELSASPR